MEGGLNLGIVGAGSLSRDGDGDRDGNGNGYGEYGPSTAITIAKLNAQLLLLNDMEYRLRCGNLECEGCAQGEVKQEFKIVFTFKASFDLDFIIVLTSYLANPNPLYNSYTNNKNWSACS